MMTRWQRYGLIGLCSWIILGGGVIAWAKSQTSPLMYDTSPTALVLQYTETHTGLAQNDPTPRLRVYGDGRMLVYFPPYMKRSGTYETYLTPAELDALLQTLLEQGVMDFDTRSIQRAVQESRVRARTSTSSFFAVSDPTLTRLEVHVQPQSMGNTRTAQRAVPQTIIWADEQAAIPALQGLATTERMLQELVSRTDLQRVE